MEQNLTKGNITGSLLRFAFPMMVGNLLQQFYNVADTLIVGRYLGAQALAAVGSAYALMVFLMSILLGLCMGSGAAFSIQYGRGNMEKLKEGMVQSFGLILVLTVVMNALVFWGVDVIISLLRVPPDIVPLIRTYLLLVFWGIGATFLYNYFASLLRAVGNSMTPLQFLGISTVLNIVLDLYFVIICGWGVAGAAFATALSQWVSGLGIFFYTFWKMPSLRIQKRHIRWNGAALKEIFSLSFLTCVQQSVMNLGILMVQGLVNSFGGVVMAAFAAAVKIDSFAYMPVQDFGNAFSTFVAQNYGAGKEERIREGAKKAFLVVFLFCLAVSGLVAGFARPLMGLFIKPEETEIIAVGVGYLRIEASFYLGIGVLFLLYGYYRAIRRPGISVVLTVISLGTRVLLAYTLSSIPAVGVTGIWLAVPVGWLLADAAGLLYAVYWNRQAGKRQKGDPFYG